MESNIKCAPLWDSEKKDFIGMITVTDFIDILRHFYKSQTDIKQLLEQHQIKTWRETYNKIRPQLIITSPDDSLYTACVTLSQKNIHRIPIIDYDNNSILHILTHAKILKFLLLQLTEIPTLFQCKIKDLLIGTFENIISAPIVTPLIEILNTLAEKNLSAVPILDNNKVMVDCYSKSDIPFLSVSNSNQLDRGIMEVIGEMKLERRLNTCTMNDTLHEILLQLLALRTHRLFIVDDEKHILGVISMSDIVKYFLK